MRGFRSKHIPCWVRCDTRRMSGVTFLLASMCVLAISSHEQVTSDVWDHTKVAGELQNVSIAAIKTMGEALLFLEDHNRDFLLTDGVRAEWLFRMGVHINSRFENSQLCLRSFQAVEVALRSFTRTVGQSNFVSIETGESSKGGPFTLSWQLGQDLRDVADEACCLGVDDAEQACIEHHDNTEGACTQHVFGVLLQAEEGFRPPALPKGRPPRYIPDQDYEAFTDGYEVKLFYMYRDDSVSGFYRGFSQRFLEAMRDMAAEGRDGVNYPDVDQTLYRILHSDSHSPTSLRAELAGAQVGIIGSAVPWYEMLVLAYGAKSAYTIEYNVLAHQHSQITTVTPEQYWGLGPERPRFKVALSISSIEHDGLGRYGDPLNPDGDMAALRQLEDILLPGGLLVLAVPVATDALVWNCHRIYGRRRLTRLLQRWTIERIEGLTDGMLDDVMITPTQPVFLLRNTRPAASANFSDHDDHVWRSKLTLGNKP